MSSLATLPNIDTDIVSFFGVSHITTDETSFFVHHCKIITSATFQFSFSLFFSFSSSLFFSGPAPYNLFTLSA